MMAKTDELEPVLVSEDGEIVEPFPADTSALPAAEMRALVERDRPDMMTPEMAKNLKPIEEVTGQLPLIHKDSLVGQPFVVMAVEVLAGRATQSDEGEDLIMMVGQVVKLDSDYKEVTKTGIHFMVTAGDEISVFGQEMMMIQAAVSPNSPVLCRFGLTKRDVAQGYYYTTRPTAAQYNGELFPE